MHFFGPRLFFFPFMLGFGLLKALVVVAIIVMLVRLFAGHRHYHWAHRGYGYWPVAEDPRRIAAMRYASGRITREEFDRIMRDLDATATAGNATPPAPTA